MDAIRSDISGSCRSDADSVWKSQIEKADYIYFRKGIRTLQFVERTKQPNSYWLKNFMFKIGERPKTKHFASEIGKTNLMQLIFCYL